MVVERGLERSDEAHHVVVVVLLWGLLASFGDVHIVITNLLPRRFHNIGVDCWFDPWGRRPKSDRRW